MSKLNGLLAGVLVESGCGSSLVYIIIIAVVVNLVFVTPTELVYNWAVQKFETPVRDQEQAEVYTWVNSAHKSAWEYHDSLYARSIHADASLYQLYQDSLQASWNNIDSILDAYQNPSTPWADRIHVMIIVGIVLCWVIIISVPICLIWVIRKRKKRTYQND